MNNRLRFLFLSAVVIVTALFLGKAPIYPKANVIIVAFDGLQARHLHVYGYPLDTTPNLDKFLGQSYLFRHSLSAAPWTVPSFMSLFTSMYPSEHKVTNKYSVYDLTHNNVVVTNLKKLTPGAMTLAEILKNQGYKTGGFTGDAGVKGAFGFSQGFDQYYDAQVFGGLDNSIPRALDWLKQNKSQKFFMFVHGYDVHGQYAPPGGFDYRYVDKSYHGPFTGSPAEQAALREKGLAGQDLGLTPDDVKFWRAIYDEKINRADQQFGDFMTQLKNLGVLDNTVIVLMSDHGIEFYEHQKFDHGHTLYGELLEVLTAIHLPGQTQGKVVSSLTSTMDLAPTILGLVGVTNPVPSQFKGIDLRSSFSGRDLSRDIFFETDYRLYTHKRGMETPDGWKLILDLNSGSVELYNLKSDPGELTNLATREPKKAYELEQKVQQHQNNMGDKGPWLLGCSPAYADQCLK